jgi:hypothetical protein
VSRAAGNAVARGWLEDREDEAEVSAAETDRCEARTPDLKIHDRTHLELNIDYPLAGSRDYEWEAYLFAPESFRLRQRTYVRTNLYDDLQSYLRLGLAPQDLDDVAEHRLPELERKLDGSQDGDLSTELRLFAARVRSATRRAVRHVRSSLGRQDTRAARLEANRVRKDVQRIQQGLRPRLEELAAGDGLVAESARKVDEDLSRSFEILFCRLSLAFEDRGESEEATQLGTDAAEEAAHRRAQGLPSVGNRKMDKRSAEHLTFRRHALKRFTSAPLWLRSDTREAGRWARHLLYAIAASVAMAFAVVAALVHGPQVNALTDRLLAWAVAVVIAYAAKDRIKAGLQGVFSDLLSRFFPDRIWHVGLPDRKEDLAEIHERAGILAWSRLPEEVRKARWPERPPAETDSRRETVVWHQKHIKIDADAASRLDARFRSIKEIFRINLRSWLDNTDDAKRTIVFADPDDGRVYERSAPRTYNVFVLYRLRSSGGHAPWRRARVVVTRKGIVRVD